MRINTCPKLFSKSFILVIGLIVALLGINSVRATVFQDDFSTALSSDWTRVGGNAKWLTDSGRLIYEAPTTAASSLYNDAWSLDGADSFLLETTMQIDPSVWSGVMFNVQDGDNYYLLRAFNNGSTIQRVQIRKFVGGTGTTLVQNTVVIPTDTDLTFSVEGIDNNGQFNIAISNGSTDLYTRFVNNSASSPLSGGFIGYQTSGSATLDLIDADSVTLTVIPEPATTGALLGAVTVALALFVRRRQSLRQ